MNTCNMNKYLLHKIAIEMDDKEVVDLCSTSKECNKKICKDNNFWKGRLYRYYPEYARYVNSINKNADWNDEYKKCYSQLYYIGELSNNFSPTLSVLAMGIRWLSCGSKHLVLVTCNNLMYGIGDNTDGQLGKGITKLIKEPTLIEQDVKYVSCGYFTTFILKFDNKLYVAGNNENGQLGFLSPKKIKKFKFLADDIKHVSAGYTHSGYVTLDNEAYAFGNNEFGQLGIDTNGENVNYPIHIYSYIKTIECGINMTALIDINDELRIVGENFGNDWLFVHNDVRQVSVGSTNCAFITQDDDLYISDGNTFEYYTSNVDYIQARNGQVAFTNNNNELFLTGDPAYDSILNNTLSEYEKPIKIADDVHHFAFEDNFMAFVSTK